MIKRLLLAAVMLSAPPVQADNLQEVLAGAERLPTDVARDARSKPASILPLLELSAGDSVADIFAGGGYYSEIIAGLVGPDGEVLLQNNAAYRAFAAAGLAQRFADRNPGAISILDSEAQDLGLGNGTLDAALIVMSYHDLFYDDSENGWPQIDDTDFLGQIHTALKPGGRLLIVDHVAAPDSGVSAAQSLHRIEEAYVVQRLAGQGFKLAGSSSALRNPDDDRSLSVFDPAIRGATDRFALVFLKGS